MMCVFAILVTLWAIDLGQDLLLRSGSGSAAPITNSIWALQVVLWLSPAQLVGRELRVLWPDEEAWFCGRVTHFDAEMGMHTV